MEEHDRLFDVCIVCAMYEEAEAVLDEFSVRCKVSFASDFSHIDRYHYRRVSPALSRDDWYLCWRPNRSTAR